jgi:hypothetical protein
MSRNRAGARRVRRDCMAGSVGPVAVSTVLVSRASKVESPEYAPGIQISESPTVRSVSVGTSVASCPFFIYKLFMRVHEAKWQRYYTFLGEIFRRFLSGCATSAALRFCIFSSCARQNRHAFWWSVKGPGLFHCPLHCPTQVYRGAMFAVLLEDWSGCWYDARDTVVGV